LDLCRVVEVEFVMRASLATASTLEAKRNSDSGRSPEPSRAQRSRPGFIATTARILWVLTLTFAALVGGIAWQAHKQCPEPCWINGLTPVEALRGAPKSMPAR
jgi:hypothetical protein